MISKELKAEYKKAFGRNPDSRMSEEKIRAKLQELPAADVKPIESIKEVKAPEPVEVKAPEVKPKETAGTNEGMQLKKGNLYLVYFRGSARYWTKGTVQVMLRTHSEQIEFPANTPYEVPATAKTCKEC